MSCPICRKRKAERFCPAKAESICAVCCGQEREVTINCPTDCPYLLSAHRYESERPRDLPADIPFRDEMVHEGVVRTHQQLLAALALSIAKFCAAEPAAVDPDVLAALLALAQTYKTLSAGLIYEKPPQAPVAGALYSTLAALLEGIKKEQTEMASSASLRDADIFALLVYLYQAGVVHSNRRPRSRQLIEFLRGQFPQAPEWKSEESRIIVP